MLALAALAGVISLAPTSSAHVSDEHGELTFHDTEDGPPADELTCRFWVEGHGLSHANVRIQVVHDRGRDRHDHTLIETEGAPNGNGTYDFAVGPLERHSHIEAGEQWVTAKMGANHSTSVARVDYTVCEDFQWWLPGDDPHGCHAPRTVTARVEGGAVVVAWADEPVRDEHELTHIVERAPGGSRDFREIARPAPNATSYRDADVEQGETYHYFVTQLLEGSRSYGYPCDHATVTVDSEGGSCPEGLEADAEPNGDVELSWNASAAADGYHVFRASDGGDRELVAEVHATAFIDTDTVAETTYRYEVVPASEAAQAGRCPAVEVTAIPFFGGPALVAVAAIGSVGALTVARDGDG